jgi:hypothetical protein
MVLHLVVDAGCHGGRELRLPSLPPRLLRGCLTQEKYGSQKLAAIPGAQPPPAPEATSAGVVVKFGSA